jgi:hypothetical protein
MLEAGTAFEVRPKTDIGKTKALIFASYDGIMHAQAEDTKLPTTYLDRHWSRAIDAVARDLAVERWQVEEAFAYGGCAALALALEKGLGLPIFIAATDEGYVHAFCAVTGDKGLDIWGVRPFRTIQSVWAEDDPDVRLCRISAQELRSMGGIHLETRFEHVPEMLASAVATILLDSQKDSVRVP